MSNIWYPFPEYKPSGKHKFKFFLIAYPNPNYIAGKFPGDASRSDIPQYLPELDTWMGDHWLNTSGLNIIAFAEIPDFKFCNEYKSGIKLDFNRQLKCVQREIYMRENHYPTFVARGKMSKAKADEELSAMKEVEKTIILARRKNLDKPWNQD